MRISRLFRKAALVSALGVMSPQCHQWQGYAPQTDPVPLSERMAAIRDRPLAHTHAHNDYKHDVPLFDALDNGFSSVEADVFLVGGKLLVGHYMYEVAGDRTLEDVYLKPLLELTRRNHGHVYPQSTESLQLMVEIKWGGGGDAAYTALEDLLERYDEMLTSYSGGVKRPGAVTVVTINYTPGAELMNARPVRRVAYETRELALEKNYDPDVTPLVSATPVPGLAWNGSGPMPENERKRLRDIVAAAHVHGQRVRISLTPENDPAARAAGWREMLDAGVDYFHTDRLPELRAWLLENDARAQGCAANKTPAPR